MSEREQEIAFVLDMVTKLCTEYEISLVPRERKGVKYVGINDNKTGKEYVMIRDNQ